MDDYFLMYNDGTLVPVYLSRNKLDGLYVAWLSEHLSIRKRERWANFLKKLREYNAVFSVQNTQRNAAVDLARKEGAVLYRADVRTLPKGLDIRLTKT